MALEKEKVLARIKNLLELSENNPSEEEAKAAFLKAQELMLKYHIDNPDTIEEDEVYKTGIDLGSLKKTEFVLMLSVVCARGFRSKTCSYAAKIYFFGFEADAKAATEVYAYLLKHSLVFRSLYFTKNRKTPQAKKEWEYGYLYGLHQAMSSRKGYELMLTVPQKVEEEFNKLEITKLYDPEKDKGTGLTSLDGAFADGFKKGKESLNGREIERK